MYHERPGVKIDHKVGIAFGETIEESKRSFVALIKKRSAKSKGIFNQFLMSFYDEMHWWRALHGGYFDTIRIQDAASWVVGIGAKSVGHAFEGLMHEAPGGVRLHGGLRRIPIRHRSARDKHMRRELVYRRSLLRPH